MLNPTDVESYSYASCRTCAWKFSRHGDAEAARIVQASGRDHAERQGHEVDVTTNERATYDCRVERPS